MSTRNKSPTKPKATNTQADISSGTANIAAKAKALKKANSPVKDVSEPAEKPVEVSGEFIQCGLGNHTLKDPRTLRCLHSFCKKCLLTHLSGKGETHSAKDKLLCPVCHQETMTPKIAKSTTDAVDQLPANEFLTSYLEAVALRDPDKLCDTCGRQGKRSVATQWCSMCHDALCDSCVKFHNALKATKQHNIVPLDQLRKQPTEKFITTPLCKRHEGENVTKYCENHFEVLCDKCVASNHKDCKGVKTLKEAVNKANADIHHVNNLIEEETKLARAIQDNRSKADDGLGKDQVDLLERIKDVRKRIDTNLSKCESHIIDELQKIRKSESTSIQNESKEANQLRKSTASLKALAESSERYGTESHQLKNLPDLAKQSEHYREKLAALNGRIKNTKIDFLVDPTLGALMKGISRLGELRVTTSPAQLPSSRTLRANKSDSDPEDEIDMMGSVRSLKADTKSLKSIKSLRSSTMFANLVENINAKTSSDTESCWFTGIAYLPDGQIVLVDRNNSKLKIISKDFKVKSEISLENQPFGITAMPPAKVAVTIPRENKIDIYSVGTSLSKSESLLISERGYGIGFAGDRFVVVCSCASPPAIKIISLTGEEKQEINPEDNYHPMFFRPWYVKLDRSGAKMYISDCHRSHVTCISGTVMKQYVYKDNSLNSPRGLDITKDGRVIVCGFGSDNIQVLDKDGNRIADLLTRSDDVMGPQDIALNEEGDKMLLTFDPSSGMSDFVRVYGVTL